MSEDGREARAAPDPEQGAAQSLATTMYTERAGSYHRFVSAVGYPQGMRAVLRGFESLRSDLKVLDAGCGGGIATLALRDALEARKLRPGITHGFDLTPAMLERFRASLARRGISDVELRQADVLHLDGLPDAWKDYDLILSSSMLEYVPRQQLSEALAGLRERLAADGALLLFISRRNGLMEYLIQRWWTANLYDREELATAMQQAGFSRVRFHRFPVSHAYLAVWGHILEARP
jgi:cyclopropane fatty-acyl-phospholipid synthase-like methyltransferase